MHEAFPKDMFFWQWLVMNVPHRQAADLMPPAAWQVSWDHRFLCSAVSLVPAQWACDVWVQRYLERQGHRSDYVATQVQRLQAVRWHLALQLTGAVPRHPRCVELLQGDGMPVLTQEQGHFVKQVLWHPERQLDPLETPPHSKHFMLTGGPGSGKTVCVDQLVVECQALEAPVLMLSPTGKVATRHLSTPSVTSMTLARLLAMEHLESMAAFARTHAAWVVCELGMVSKTDWEQVYYLWKACDCWPTLVAEGDFAQLPPPVADWKAVDCRLSATLQWHRAYRCRANIVAKILNFWAS